MNSGVKQQTISTGEEQGILYRMDTCDMHELIGEWNEQFPGLEKSIEACIEQAESSTSNRIVTSVTQIDGNESVERRRYSEESEEGNMTDNEESMMSENNEEFVAWEMGSEDILAQNGSNDEFGAEEAMILAGGDNTCGMNKVDRDQQFSVNFSGRKVHRCDVCGYQTLKSSYLKAHLRVHTGERPYTCDECHYRAKYASGLHKHKLSRHSTDTTTMSSDCKVRWRDVGRHKQYTSHAATLRLYHRSHTDIHLYSDAVNPECGPQAPEDPITPKDAESNTGGSSDASDNDAPIQSADECYKCPICRRLMSAYVSLPDLHGLDSTGIVRVKTEDEEDQAMAPTRLTQEPTGSDRKWHKCDLCDYSTTVASNLSRHNYTHTGEKPHACDMCDHRSASANRLAIHKYRHTGEGEKKPHACDMCDYSSSDARYLAAHKCKHTGEKPYACDVCDYRTASDYHLARHKRSHTGEKLFMCDICGHRTFYSYDLSIHKRTHTGEKPHMCDMCDFRAACSSTLLTHKRTHTGEKPYVCDKCDYRASQHSQLVRHKRRMHTGEKPFMCDMCDYRAAVASLLTMHKRTHTGEKPYVCDKCDYRAAQHSQLVRHKRRMHTGEKPHMCDRCDYRAARASYLAKHIRTHTE